MTVQYDPLPHVEYKNFENNLGEYVYRMILKHGKYSSCEIQPYNDTNTSSRFGMYSSIIKLNLVNNLTLKFAAKAGRTYISIAEVCLDDGTWVGIDALSDRVRNLITLALFAAYNVVRSENKSVAHANLVNKANAEVLNKFNSMSDTIYKPDAKANDGNVDVYDLSFGKGGISYYGVSFEDFKANIGEYVDYIFTTADDVVSDKFSISSLKCIADAKIYHLDSYGCHKAFVSKIGSNRFDLAAQFELTGQHYAFGLMNSENKRKLAYAFYELYSELIRKLVRIDNRAHPASEHRSDITAHRPDFYDWYFGDTTMEPVDMTFEEFKANIGKCVDFIFTKAKNVNLNEHTAVSRRNGEYINISKSYTVSDGYYTICLMKSHKDDDTYQIGFKIGFEIGAPVCKWDELNFEDRNGIAHWLYKVYNSLREPS